MRDPFPLVCRLGERLPWSEQKALVLLVAISGPWEAGACQLADALGIGPVEQEAIRAEALQHRAAGLLNYPLPQEVAA